MQSDIDEYHLRQSAADNEIMNKLRKVIEQNLPEATSKVWHAHPVWFIDGNPTVGYSKLKNRVRLLFWSGADFDETSLEAGSGKFKDAHIDYVSADQINEADLKKWLEKSKTIQWNYKDIVKNKGELERL